MALTRTVPDAPRRGPVLSARSPGSTARGGEPGSVLALAEQARVCLASARDSADVGERFRLAHLAALRTAAILVAWHGRPASTRRRLVSAWVLVESITPEFGEWARFFASWAAKRAAVEAGALSVVSAREADDQLRAAEQFLDLVESSVGLLSARLAS